MATNRSARKTVPENAAAIPSASPEAEYSPRLQRTLLEPAAWQEPLKTFANVTHVAVALADLKGRLLGECINPRPLWSLLQNRANRDSVGCPFSFGIGKACCTCIADGIKRGTPVTATDRVGLTHVTVPLRLGGVPVGALLAGQVFDRYPEQLPLEQLAKKYALNRFDVWQLARRETPVSAAALLVFGELLANLGNTFLQNRYEQVRESARLAEMTRLHTRAVDENAERRRAEDALRESEEHLRHLNASLEARVAERTCELQRNAEQRQILASQLAVCEQKERRQLATLLHENVQQMLVAARMRIECFGDTLSDDGSRNSLVEIVAILNRATEALRSMSIELAPPLHHDEGLSVALEWLVSWMHEQYGLEVALKTDSSADPPTVEGRDLMIRAARELFLNIVKHAGTKQVSARLIRQGDFSVIEISDRGKGFNSADLETSRRSLGLFQIRDRLEAVSGRLLINTRPGGGTRIELRLPLDSASNDGENGSLA